MTALRFLSGGLIAGGLLAGPASAGALDILPHRAFYEMSLGEAEGRSNVADVDGFMLFEWADSCDGWSLTQKLAMTVYYSTGESTAFGWSLNSWESKDGLKYRFFVRRIQDGREQEALRGDAELMASGRGGTARYTEPARREVQLPPGTLFPTAHTLAVLERAEAGEHLFWSEVFDGSDEDGLYGVGAVMGNRIEAPGTDATQTRKLLEKVPSWRLGLAFFPHESPELEPEHEQNLRLYRNGVAEELLLEYGDFTVSTSLTKLEALPAPGC